MSFVIAFFRKPQSWPIVMIPLGLLLWARLAAPALSQASFNSFAYFDSPYRGALPAGRPGEAVAQQVVIVVLDGLRNAAYFVVHGYTYSVSLISTETSSRQLLAGAVTDAMLALMAAMLVVGILRRKAGAGEIARAAVNTLFLVAAAMAVDILIFYVAWDVVFITSLPDLNWGFKLFLDVLQTTAFWPMTAVPWAALLPLFALLAAWVAKLAVRLHDA